MAQLLYARAQAFSTELELDRFLQNRENCEIDVEFRVYRKTLKIILLILDRQLKSSLDGFLDTAL